MERLLLLFSAAYAYETSCEADGTCVYSADDYDCKLYMAPSSTGQGWGLFTGVDLDVKDEVLPPNDVAILLTDSDYEIPQSWNPHVYWSTFEAKAVQVVVPGIGFYARTTTTGLHNIEPEGCHSKFAIAKAGEITECQDSRFSTMVELVPAGHELLVKGGADEVGRDGLNFDDFQILSDLIMEWEGDQSGDLDTEEAKQAYDKMRQGISQESIRKLLPKDPKEAEKMMFGTLADGKTPLQAAHWALGPEKILRSPNWLNKNGYCLDGLNTKESEVGDALRGPFVTTSQKAVRKHRVVATVPMIPIERKNMADQLMLNYCFGHPKSDLLLFPTAPGFHNIQPATSKYPANVKLVWHLDSKDEWGEASIEKVIDAYNNDPHFKIIFELVATADIGKGEGLRLDFGSAWMNAWNSHQATWKPSTRPANSKALESAWDYDTAKQIYTLKDPEYPPPTIQVRCWVQRDKLDASDEDGWYGWNPVDDDKDGLENTEPCTVLEAESQKTYRVMLDDHIQVKKIPWASITIVSMPYKSNQFLPGAFRHEIGGADALWPRQWREGDASDSRTESNGAKVEPEEEFDGSCGLYVAESAIPNSGLGMYTAELIEKDARIFYGDVVINVEDIEENMELRAKLLGQRFNPNEDVWLLENYFWKAHSAHAQFEAAHVESIVPGLGMLANSHPGLINAEMVAPHREALLHRGSDPGSGASTTFHDVHYLAREGEIEAGAELFVEYGDNWFKRRTDDFGPLPLSDDYVKADDLMEMMWDIIKDDPESQLAHKIFKLLLRATDSSVRLQNALPRTVGGIEHVLNMGGSGKNSVPGRVKTPSWLRENGRCLDHIRPGVSTVKQAGRGAFATRDLPEGTVVAPLPLVQVARHHMEVYAEIKYDEDGNKIRPYIRHEGTQQLLNYCYGHPESSLLLFPYAPIVNYLNHHATEYNAELRWSSLPNHHEDWLDRTPESLLKEPHAGMIMEVVAIKDIKEGDEIFLNYGEAWEKKWQEYVASFSPGPSRKQFVPAVTLDETTDFLRTEEELKTNPYEAQQAFTMCFTATFDGSFRAEEGKRYEWKSDPIMFDDSEQMYPCTVVRRDNETNMYTVRVELDGRDTPDVLMINTPRKAIRFFDDEYTSDFTLRSAFRHEIHIPDVMIPEVWKDMKPNGKNKSNM